MKYNDNNYLYEKKGNMIYLIEIDDNNMKKVLFIEITDKIKIGYIDNLEQENKKFLLKDNNLFYQCFCELFFSNPKDIILNQNQENEIIISKDYDEIVFDFSSFKTSKIATYTNDVLFERRLLPVIRNIENVVMYLTDNISNESSINKILYKIENNYK